MTLTNPPFRRTPRWARTLVLVSAVGLFPLAPAQAGEAAAKPQSDRAQRDTAPAEQNRVVERLRAAVERGDMTPEQARRTYAQVQNDRPLTDRAPRVTDRAPDADTLAGQLRRAGVDAPMREDIVAYFQKQGVGRVQMEATLGAMVRLTHAVREQGEGFRPTDAMAEHLRREIGLDAEQSRAVLEVARKLAAVQAQPQTDRAPHAEHSDVDIRGYYLRLGLDGQAYDQVVAALREHGLGRVQVEPTLGGLFHTVLSIHEHGVEATMQDEKFRAFFTDQVGLDDEQLALVASLAQRIAAATAPAERDRPERDAAPQRRERERAEAAERAERELRHVHEQAEQLRQLAQERAEQLGQARRVAEEQAAAAQRMRAELTHELAALRREREALAQRLAEMEHRLVAAEREREAMAREREAQARRAAEQAERAERVAREQRIARERATDAERAARAREQAAERERAEMREREAAAERERRVLEEREAADRERRARRDRERAEREQAEREQAESDDKVDFAARAERIRAAYAAGELPRVDARRELNALREQMIHQVELALEAEKITRDEAREKVEAIRAMTQLPEREGDAR